MNLMLTLNKVIVITIIDLNINKKRKINLDNGNKIALMTH